MACFLLMTQRDFDQLSAHSGLRHGIDFIRAEDGSVIVQVYDDTIRTVRQMAADIRHFARSARPVSEREAHTQTSMGLEEVIQRFEASAGTIEIEALEKWTRVPIQAALRDAESLSDGEESMLRGAAAERGTEKMGNLPNFYKGDIGEMPVFRKLVVQHVMPEAHYIFAHAQTEKEALAIAEDFFKTHPESQVVMLDRSVPGSGRSKIDASVMAITRQDINSDEPKPIYMNFECKYKNSQLSWHQKQPSYHLDKAREMLVSGDPVKAQLGKDILDAAQEGRTMYITSKVNPISGTISYERKD